MNITQDLPQQLEPEPTPRKWPRRAAIGVGLVAVLGVGVAIGAAGHSTGVSQAEYTASQAQASSLRGQVSGLRAQVSTDNAAVATARTTAATAQQTANANAAAAYQSKQAALESTYQSKQAALQSQQQTVAGEQRTLQQELGEVQANTISSDGTFVVGQDIKPGTYHTNGSGNAGANDCYYATLNSTDGSDRLAQAARATTGALLLRHTSPAVSQPALSSRRLFLAGLCRIVRTGLYCRLRLVGLCQLGEFRSHDVHCVLLQDRHLLPGDLPHDRPVDTEVLVHRGVAERSDLAPGNFWVPVSQGIRERACDLTQQKQPVEDCVSEHPVLIPVLAADAIQVLTNGTRAVDKVGDIELVMPHKEPVRRPGPDRG
jgi:hypothetical protein